MKPARAADKDAIAAFLFDHLTYPMFPLSNLLAHGMVPDQINPDNPNHPLGMWFWLTRDGNQITDALGMSVGSMVFPVCPSGAWSEVWRDLAGRGISSVFGQSEACRALMQAAGLTDHPMEIDADEVMFDLALPDLKLPEGAGHLVPFSASPREVVIGWLCDYLIETMNVPSDKAMVDAVARFDRFSASGSHLVLMDGDTPLAMTGFNADVDHTVQIGGVYTPPLCAGADLRRGRSGWTWHRREMRAKGGRFCSQLIRQRSVLTVC